MRKILRAIIVLLLVGASSPLTAQRYLSEVYPNVTVTPNQMYARNWSVLLKYTQGGPVFMDTLRADIYEPVGDTMQHRPTILLAHPGSGLPIFYNYLTVGDKGDSTIAEQCRQFAKRGYTAIAFNYRLGWNPFSPDQDTRSGTLLQAVGRMAQDAKACVRYFRNDAMNANTWHIDPNKIILGGDGIGGTAVMGVATLTSLSQISLLRFLAANTNSAFCFTSGVSYFDSTCWGSILTGMGGDPNSNYSGNTPGISNAIQFAFGEEALIGDSSWTQAGNPPMVSFQVANDSLDPYDCGPVYNPFGYITDVCGGHTYIKEADGFNNNFKFQNNNWPDPFTVHAKAVNGTTPNRDGLYPFLTPGDQQAPWEFFDSTYCFQIMIGVLGFTMGHADSVWYNAISTNPLHSRSNGLAYIDTIMGYLNPRIVAALDLLTGVDELGVLEKFVSVYPNPATKQFTISVSSASVASSIENVELMDMTGRMLYHIEKSVTRAYTFQTTSLDAGIYFVKIKTDKGDLVKKVVIE